jgi:hypothetical protein
MLICMFILTFRKEKSVKYRKYNVDAATVTR